MKMKFNASVTLKFYDSYYMNLNRHMIIKKWLDENNIKYKELTLYVGTRIPHTYLMDSEDAVALRLRFNL
jgi:hypothetical protein